MKQSLNKDIDLNGASQRTINQGYLLVNKKANKIKLPLNSLLRHCTRFLFLIFNLIMTASKKLINTLTPYSFVIKFVFLFLFLYALFPFMRGITAPGGEMYFSFADTYLNVVRGLTTFLTSAAKGVLEMLQYHTNQRDYQTLRIESSRGVIINPTCLGWGVMSFWVAFVVANKGAWQHKLKWLAIGLGSILLLNIMRVAIIALANHLQWEAITSLDQHLFFNILSYCIIILMVIWFVTVQKKYETRRA